jgi:hypothetical protein
LSYITHARGAEGWGSEEGVSQNNPGFGPDLVEYLLAVDRLARGRAPLKKYGDKVNYAQLTAPWWALSTPPR